MEGRIQGSYLPTVEGPSVGRAVGSGVGAGVGKPVGAGVGALCMYKRRKEHHTYT